jgi:hypothetical protein
MDNANDLNLPKPVSESQPEAPSVATGSPEEAIPSEFGEEESETPEDRGGQHQEAPAPEQQPPSEPIPSVAPVVPSEPVLPAATPPAATPPTKSGVSWGWLIACGVGCVALAIALAIILGGVTYFVLKAQDEVEQTTTTTIENISTPAEEESSSSELEGAASTPTEQPGEESAKKAALADEPDWVARVQSHSSDWTEAVVWTGPPESEFVWAYTLRWDDRNGQYDVLSMDTVGP